MKTLKEIIDRRLALKTEDTKKRADFGKWCEAFKEQMRELAEAEALLSGSVDLGRLNHGLHVVEIYGDYRRCGGEAASCIPAAKAAIASGGGILKREYVGAKNYDRWSGQRCDCSYGFGPTHGSIVFSIGLTPIARRETLTAEQIEDALYVLANIDKVLDARKAARDAA